MQEKGERITCAILPDSIETIGRRAFDGCTTLTDIKIPYGVENIETSAFYGCENLTTVVIPDSVTHIGNYAFLNCKNLECIKINFEKLTSIGENIFPQHTKILPLTEEIKSDKK